MMVQFINAFKKKIHEPFKFSYVIISEKRFMMLG